MVRADRAERDSESETSGTSGDGSGVRRRRLLGGMVAGAAVPFVADAAVPSGDLFGSVAATDLPPTEDWTSSPTDTDINSLRSDEGYLIARTGDGFVSVDQATGERLWKRSTGSQASRIGIYAGRPYVVEGSTLTALDSAGNERWSLSYENDVSIQFRIEGPLYAASGPMLEALSQADGSTVWSVEPPNLDDIENVTENLVLTTEGGSSKEVVGAYDRSNGSLAWRSLVASNVSLTQTSFGEERVYYGYGSTMDAINVSDGTTAWSREFQSGLPFIFEIGGTAYMFKEGKVAELSSEDGSEVWSLSVDGFPLPTDFVDVNVSQRTASGVVAVTQSTVYKITLDGTQEWKYEVQDTQNFGRANAVGDLVYASDGDTLVEIDGGEATWTYQTDGTTLKSVAADDQRVYSNDTGTIYAFKHGVENAGGTTTTAGGGGGTTTAGGGGGTTTAGGGGGTTTAGEGGGETTAPSGETTATMGTDAGTTAESGGDGTNTGTDSGEDGDGGSGQTPGFGILTAVAAALLAAARLLGDDEDEE